MFRLILLALLALAAWKGYEAYRARQLQATAPAVPAFFAAPTQARPATPTFTCDGRTHCSQMTSCLEATYFLKNCPGTKMDGNNDGVPCEQQWCH